MHETQPICACWSCKLETSQNFTLLQTALTGATLLQHPQYAAVGVKGGTAVTCQTAVELVIMQSEGENRSANYSRE